MELSILHIFIEHGNYFGILKFSIKREYHNLCICMDVYQINTSSKDTIEIFRNNLLSDPNNPNIINIIPTKHVLNDIFQLMTCEKMIEYIKSIPDVNDGQSYRLDFGSKLSCTVTMPQVKRIYNFFNTFVSNFALLDSIFKIYINMLKLGEDTPAKVETKEVPTIEETKFVEEIINPITSIDLPAKKDKTLLESIIEDYSINNIYRSYLINHLFSHLRYISESIKINKDTITISNLFDSSFVVNYNYILSVLDTTLDNNYDNTISFNQKKIVESIITIIEKESTDKRQDLDNKLVLSIMLFIFYSYQYRFIMSKYPDYDFDNYFKSETQQSGLNYFFKTLSPSKEIKFEIVEAQESTEDQELINEVSDQYKHLIPVSQEEFLDLAVKEYISKKENKEDKSLDFTLSNTKLINITNLIQSNSAINKLINNNSSTINTTTYNDRSSPILSYEAKIITKTYNYFKQYVDNPLSIKNIIELKDIPKSVLNLFDYFKRHIANMFSDKEDVSTLSYYKILKKNLPASNTHSHQTFLFIIFNLIIPFYYDEYKKDVFVDSFL